MPVVKPEVLNSMSNEDVLETYKKTCIGREKVFGVHPLSHTYTHIMNDLEREINSRMKWGTNDEMFYPEEKCKECNRSVEVLKELNIEIDGGICNECDEKLMKEWEEEQKYMKKQWEDTRL